MIILQEKALNLLKVYVEIFCFVAFFNSFGGKVINQKAALEILSGLIHYFSPPLKIYFSYL